jgi:predicted metal-binding membrane protein
MNSPSFSGTAQYGSKLQLFFWRYPEWWTVAVCGLAWAAMIPESWRHAGHRGHQMSFAQECRNWMLMVAAMMLPLILYSVRAAAARSLWARRHVAIGIFLVGFFALWLIPGIVAASLRQLKWAHPNWIAGTLFLFAALWHRLPIRLRGLEQCHRVEPLAPRGWRANADCLRFGGAIGVICIWSCWPLMLACAFTGHDSVAMAGGMLVGISERWYYRPRTRRVLFVTLLMAAYYAGLDANRLLAFSSESRAEVIAATKDPFVLSGETRVTLAMHSPEDPQLRANRPGTRVFLNLESLTSQEPSGPWDIYLNLGAKQSAAEHPEVEAAELPMYGLVESSHPRDKNKPGLTYQFDVTNLFARLPGLPGWDPRRLAVTFVPKYASQATIRVGKVSVSVAGQ